MLKQSRVIALSHHEKYDGTGYPRGLSGEEIPIEGRITLLADIFDALSSKRVYKDSFPEVEVLRIMEEGRGSLFDPKILDVLLGQPDTVREVRGRYADQKEDFDKFKNLDRLTIEE